ncbi:MAG: hypothetical protein CMP40_00060 [Rickettsiales bacterium]|nr:hypothetical protein [Rickettsiales bacterium]
MVYESILHLLILLIVLGFLIYIFRVNRNYFVVSILILVLIIFIIPEFLLPSFLWEILLEN